MTLEEIIAKLESDASYWKDDDYPYYQGKASGLEVAAQLLRDYLEASKENNPDAEE